MPQGLLLDMRDTPDQRRHRQDALWGSDLSLRRGAVSRVEATRTLVNIPQSGVSDWIAVWLAVGHS